MKKLIYTAAALLLSLTSCTKEDNLEGGRLEPGEGTRVSLTLKGSAETNMAPSRANGSEGSVSGKLAAQPFEKKVGSLLAVAFYKNDNATAGITKGTLYRVFEVLNLDNTNGSLPWFDMGMEGRFDVWFVANANTALADQIKALAPQTSTYDDFKVLVTDQPSDTADKFLMVSTQAYDIATVTGATISVSVVMQRAAVRVDIINRIPGVTITSAKFVNRAIKSRIAKPNDETEAPGAYDSEKIYTTEFGDTGLVGYLPPKEGDGTPDEAALKASKCEAKIYSYENLNDDAAQKISTLELTYTVDKVTDPSGTPIEKKYLVEFKVPVADTPDKMEQLQLQRNHLYRVVLNEKHSDMMVSANIIVEDWNTATEQFEVADTPFDPSDNKSLLVNRFAPYNAKNVDLQARTFEFNTLFDNHPDYEGMTFTKDDITRMKEYFNIEDLRHEGMIGFETSPVFTADGRKWRMPTMGELELLAPAEDIKIVFGAEALPKASGKETIYLKNNISGAPATDGEMIEGAFELKKAATAQTLLDGTQVFTVYGIRFKTHEQESAYRWQVCDMPDTKKGDSERYISVQIKSTKNIDAGSKTIAKIADETFWQDGFIEFKIPCTGVIADGRFEMVNRGTQALLRCSTLGFGEAVDFGGVDHVAVNSESSEEAVNYAPLRFVEATAEDEAAWNRIEADVKASRSHPYFHAAIGDFFLSDGTLVKANEMEALPPEKKAMAVAIICSTDRNRMGKGAKQLLGGEYKSHGIALALKNAGEKLAWAKAGKESVDIADIPTLNILKDSFWNIDGYTSTQAVYTEATDLATEFPVFNAVKNYPAQAPTGTTGWYLPSIGEWIDILIHLGCSADDVLKQKIINVQTDTNGMNAYTSTSGSLGVAISMNEAMQKVGAENFEPIVCDASTYSWFYSSSEYAANMANYVYLHNNKYVYFNYHGTYIYVTYYFVKKDEDATGRVRTVFAF